MPEKNEYMPKVAALDATPLTAVTGRDVGMVGSNWTTGAFVGGGTVMVPCSSPIVAWVGEIVGDSKNGTVVSTGERVGFEVVGFWVCVVVGFIVLGTSFCPLQQLRTIPAGVGQQSPNLPCWTQV